MDSSTNSETVHQRHDTSYRFLLSSKKLFVELLRSFIDKGWVQAVDEEHVQEIPHSFVLQDFKRQEADLVYRVKLNGQDVVFYLLLEMQSSVDFRMPYRLLLYQVEIWRYWLQNEEEALSNRKSFQLPPIIPIVLYNGKEKWTAERQFRKLLSNEEMFDSELLNFEYLLIDVARYTEEELLSLSNTIGSVFLLDQTEDQEHLLNRLGKLMNTIQQMPEDNQQKFVAWMANILLQKLPENEPSLQQFIQSVKGDAAFMGLEKILDDIERKGEQKGKEQVVKQMIAEQLDPDLISRVTGFSLDKINQLRKETH
ncbi:Rpn family recombination-promoting nuclease/putative transposase [Paenibacillus ginsengihumi]|uniref:Rpn family recombination-promoting nuclease/putative transposase n=1 Tax=Paenibacillus ginsengihumi TaxID=431596 RepID=UPI000376CE60|nr:Rpn family recombination-promoting nuclease/putative transposase [Paenibacillus ginsengihumi]